MVINQKLSQVEGRKAVVLFTDGVDTTSKRASYQSTVLDSEELDALIYPVQYDTFIDVAGGGPAWPSGRQDDILGRYSVGYSAAVAVDAVEVVRPLAQADASMKLLTSTCMI